MKQIFLLSAPGIGTATAGDGTLGIGVTSEKDAQRFVDAHAAGETRAYRSVVVYDNLERALASRDPHTAVQLPTVLGGVPVTGELDVPVEAAINSVPFRDWLASMDLGYFQVKRVHIQAVDMFGPRVGFIKFVATVVDPQGGFVPGATFMRGGAVGILPVFVCGPRYWTVLTVQPRLPTGRRDFVECAAGMLDGSGNFAGVAAKELLEELEISVSQDDLTDLSELAGNKGTFLSPGGSDEVLRYFGFKKVVTAAWLKEKNGRCTGVLAENEKIKLWSVPMSSLWKMPDAKTVAMYAYFRMVGHQIRTIT